MTIAFLLAVANATMDLQTFPGHYLSDIALHLDWPSVVER